MSVGPAGNEFIEIYNPTGTTLDLASVTLVTGAGTFDLSGYTSNIPGHDYFCLVRDVSGSAGVGDKRISVTDPLSTFTSDTLLLERGTEILDAVSFGTTRDTSERYTAAINAGQFNQDQYLNVSAQVEPILIGRDATGSDTNDMSADWKIGHSMTSWGPTPFADNTGGGLEEGTVTWQFLKWANELCLGGYGLSVVSTSHTGYTVSNGIASATYGLVTRAESGAVSPFNTSQTVSGVIDTELTRQPGGYTYTHDGTLSNSAMSISISMTEVVSGNGHSRSFSSSATLWIGSDCYSYSDGTTSSIVGGPSLRSRTDIRQISDFSGEVRDSSSTFTIHPLIAGGDVGSASGMVSVQTDYPVAPPQIWEYRAWVQDGSQGPKPCAVSTTLAESYNITMTRTTSGFSWSVSDHNLAWGDDTTQSYENESGSLSCDPTSREFTGSHSFEYTKDGATHTITKTLDGLAYENGDFQFTITLDKDGSQLGTYGGYIDGFWGQVWHWGATIVTGAACFVGTTATAVGTGVASAKTLGALLKPGLAATAAVAGACALITNEVYDATKPK